MDDIKIVYMGTPDFSVLPLKELNNKYNIVGVVTQPDKMVGRKKEIKFSPVKEFAIENNLKVIQPIKIREDYKEILDLKPDIIITCAYGQIIPKELLNYPKYGCINIHASLLPKLRGGAPIHKAIINGYETTGVTIMYMDEKMDSGDIIYQEKIKIENDDNAGTLFDKLSVLGSKMIIDILPSILNKTNKRIKQDENEVTYAYNITREEEKIDFNKTTKEVYDQIRGLYPWPVGYTTLDEKKVKIYTSLISNTNKQASSGEIINIYNDSIGVKTKDGEIKILELQFEGKKRISVKDYLNGIQDKNSLIGKVFK
ncbi:MAG: methionyl-tRNA formyltransferase [Bacilli bacterium]|nr:methionyl-tRNA formyltransferase [Bacilli bacterium]